MRIARRGAVHLRLLGLSVGIGLLHSCAGCGGCFYDEDVSCTPLDDDYGFDDDGGFVGSGGYGWTGGTGGSAGATECESSERVLRDRVNGMCVAVGCVSPYGSCEGFDETCEADFRTDVRHCGACANPCVGTDCIFGSCFTPERIFAATEGAVAVAAGVDGTYIASEGNPSVVVFRARSLVNQAVLGSGRFEVDDLVLGPKRAFVLDSAARRIVSVPRIGGDLALFAETAGPLTAIATDASSLYLAEGENAGDAGVTDASPEGAIAMDAALVMDADILMDGTTQGPDAAAADAAPDVGVPGDAALDAFMAMDADVPDVAVGLDGASGADAASSGDASTLGDARADASDDASAGGAVPDAASDAAVSGGRLVRIDLGSATVSTVARFAGVARAVSIADDTAYVATTSPASILAIAVADGASTILAEGDLDPVALTVTDTHVYFAGTGAPRVARVDRFAPGTVEMVAPLPRPPADLVVADDAFVSTNDPGRVYRVGSSAGLWMGALEPPVRLAAGRAFVYVASPTGVFRFSRTP